VPPPPAVPPAAAGGAPPPGPGSGDSFARGVFLYLGGTSLLGGVVAVVGAARIGSGAAAAIFGVAFALLFFTAMMLRPGRGLDPVRATLGVVSVLFLVACFALVVGVADQGQVDTSTQLVRAAVAAGLLTFGMAGIGVLIPSAVGAGLSLAGLVATVVLAAAAAGATGIGLAVAGLVSGAATLEVAFHVPRLRAHPAATAWMVNLAALLTGVAATILGAAFQGTAMAAVALTGAALVLVAWRWRSVAAAVAAVGPLTLFEGYAIVEAVGGDATAEGVVFLLVGLVLLMVVALVGNRARATGGDRRRAMVVDEGLLVAAVVVALISLTQSGGGLSPFQRSPFVNPGGIPLITPSVTPPPFPTFPTG